MDNSFNNRISAFLSGGIESALIKLREENSTYRELCDELAITTTTLEFTNAPAEKRINAALQLVKIFQGLQELEQPCIYLLGIRDYVQLQESLGQSNQFEKFVEEFINSRLAENKK